MPYLPIEDYGIIGDMYTVALVGKNGSIDWLCLPSFDSPSLFAAILDDQQGGRFSITSLAVNTTYKQLYWPDTNVLVTRFLTSEGAAELIDFMPVLGKGLTQRRLIRRLRVLRGCMNFRLVCQPAFNYARDDHETYLQSDSAIFISKNLTVGLTSPVPMQEARAGVQSEFQLHEGDSYTFVLQTIEPGSACDVCLTAEESEDLFVKTVQYWRDWLSQSNYSGRWREMVHRSALALKLLTYAPTGAIVAAPTCSLPEGIGGERNWDYRYSWIRDSAFTLYALLRLGFRHEARDYINFLASLCAESHNSSPLQILYSIHGDPKIEETTLSHLQGYRGSQPVRVGNRAYDQLQLDIYGELLDAAYLYNKYGSPISYDLWVSLRSYVNWVCEHWQQKDRGIWEVRANEKMFVYSKVMCWVAVDRGLRLARKRSFPADELRWVQVRNTIYEDIQTQGWSESRQSFVQSYGSQNLDAANLMMPLTFFMAPNDPRILATLKATLRSPDQGGLVSNNLVYRYNIESTADGLEGMEGTFNICSFWLVEALTRAGRYDKAYLEKGRLIFESMLGFSNHLGLYAEETGPCGEALGNFPQAFTHLALISSAYNLDRALN
ncbi:MAG: glycoside hydrolase family 15 protein [Synechococcaceae cyanobacterium SM2_3_1]|nr:glycoside hydrolase family 15 protein [Synechococcaceae cyanobacterium SM2_3_1]